MDTLTVIFTGLMIFDFQGYTIYPVDASGHEYSVQIGSNAPRRVKKVEFGYLEPGASSPVQNFSLLSLTKLVGKELQPHKTFDPISLNFMGLLRPLGAFDVCKAEDYTALSWQGVQWDVKVQNGKTPTIILDGETVALTNLPMVRISNDYPAGMGSHLPMYSIGVRDASGNPVTVRKCEGEGFKNLLVRNNPVTCPPVSLR
jgi:hypothetical protein